MPDFCVTGGTGFIAAYLIKRLLEDGHSVRTTVRDPCMLKVCLVIVFENCFLF